MKKTTTFLIAILLLSFHLHAQFDVPPTNWNVPNDFEDFVASGRIAGTNHTTLDINGDGLPDLIDGIDVSSGNSRVWGYNTSQYYWKVYINNGAGFNSTPIQWNVPNDFEDFVASGRVSGSNHATMDINGDGLPDLIDGIDVSSGNSRVWGYNTTQYYWKVYINNGAGFNSTPIQWNVPNDFEDFVASGRIAGANHTTIDINGDGLPDLIDGIDVSSGNSRVWGYNTTQYYWKVYINSGAGFNSTPIQWNVPNDFEDFVASGRVSGSNHATVDIDGDGLPDLIDGIDVSSGNSRVWGYNTTQYYWKVYINNGAGFNSTPIQWNVPNDFEDFVASGRIAGSNHTTLDLNDDGLPDLIDGIDVSSGNSRVWGYNTSQYYWKIYWNNGAGFDSSPFVWNVPNDFEDIVASGRVSGANHATLDLNGDGLPDLIDGIDVSSGNSRVWGYNSTQYYWKVYFNDFKTLISSISVMGEGGAETVSNLSSLQMVATILPSNATNTDLVWTVTNGTGLANIDANGLLTGINPGGVTVFATATDGSGITGSKTITIEPLSTGIDDAQKNLLHIYPNPVGDYLMVNLEEDINATVKLLDVQGKMVHTEKVFSKDVTINTSHLHPGLYFIQISSDKAQAQQHFIKE